MRGCRCDGWDTRTLRWDLPKLRTVRIVIVEKCTYGKNQSHTRAGDDQWYVQLLYSQGAMNDGGQEGKVASGVQRLGEAMPRDKESDSVPLANVRAAVVSVSSPARYIVLRYT